MFVQPGLSGGCISYIIIIIIITIIIINNIIIILLLLLRLWKQECFSFTW